MLARGPVPSSRISTPVFAILWEGQRVGWEGFTAGCVLVSHPAFSLFSERDVGVNITPTPFPTPLDSSASTWRPVMGMQIPADSWHGFLLWQWAPSPSQPPLRPLLAPPGAFSTEICLLIQLFNFAKLSPDSATCQASCPCYLRSLFKLLPLNHDTFQPSDLNSMKRQKIRLWKTC